MFLSPNVHTKCVSSDFVKIYAKLILLQNVHIFATNACRLILPRNVRSSLFHTNIHICLSLNVHIEILSLSTKLQRNFRYSFRDCKERHYLYKFPTNNFWPKKTNAWNDCNDWILNFLKKHTSTLILPAAISSNDALISLWLFITNKIVWIKFD
jgi:hypothetical protein